jgi:hypothetical protein
MKIVVLVHILQDSVIGDEVEDIFRRKLKLLTVSDKDISAPDRPTDRLLARICGSDM